MKRQYWNILIFYPDNLAEYTTTPHRPDYQFDEI